MFQDDFEGSSLDPHWKIGSTNNGRAALSNQNGPASGVQHLVLDDSVSDAIPSVAEAILTLDLSNKKNVVVSFKAKSLGNEPDQPPTTNFTSTRAFDGVSISGDGGVTWRTIQTLAATSTNWTSYVVTLDSSVAALGTVFGSSFLIRFSEYDNGPAPLDGIAIDDVIVTADDDQRAVLELPSPVVEGQSSQIGYALLAFAPASPVVLTLTATPAGQIDLPPTVTIPAGQSYAAFTFSVIDDTLVNLSRIVTVRSSATGVTSSPASLLVLDDEAPIATLTIPNQLVEGAVPISNATISLDRTPSVPVTLNLSATPIGELSFPSTVTIPAGQTQATFTIRAFDDTKIDGDIPVTVSASNVNVATVTAQTTAIDNESKGLALLLPPTVTEGDTGTGFVRLTGTLTTPLLVTLTSSNTAQANVPASVVIPAGQTQTGFLITAAENTLRDGSRTISIGGEAATFTSAATSMIVRDNEAVTYRFGALADIINIGSPLAVTISAIDVEGNTISGGGNTIVGLDLVLPNGSTQPLTPALAPLTAGSWSGNVTLPSITSTPLKLRASDANGTTGESAPFDILRMLNIVVNNIIWDAARSTFYASVPSTSSTYANNVIAINPATLSVTASAATNNEPNALALTSSGEYLYVALDGNGTVAKIDPGTMTVISSFSVGIDPFYGKLYAEEIVPVAGQPNTVIVSQYRTNTIPRHNGVAVYDNGVIRPNKTRDSSGNNRIEPSADPTVYFGFENESSELGFHQLQLSATGMAETQAKVGLFAKYSHDFHADGNKAYSDIGEEVDGALMKRLGVFTLPNGSGASRPDLAANRVYFIEGTNGSYSFPSTFDKIGAYDPTTFALIRRLRLPTVYDTVSNFIRWGTNGLAFKASAGVVIINSSQLVPSDPVADLSSSVTASTNPATVGAPLIYTIKATNNGPNTAKNVILGTTLSAGQSFQSASASIGTATTSGSVVSLPIGDLAVGTTVTLMITTTPTQAGSVTATASANSTSVDMDLTNNTGFNLVSVGFVSALDMVNSLRLAANNLIYDSTRKLLWASLPGTVDAPLGRSLVSINPTNGLMSDPIAINANPVGKCMALSANGRYLYVGLSDAPGSRQI